MRCFFFLFFFGVEENLLAPEQQVQLSLKPATALTSTSSSGYHNRWELLSHTNVSLLLNLQLIIIPNINYYNCKMYGTHRREDRSPLCQTREAAVEKVRRVSPSQLSMAATVRLILRCWDISRRREGDEEEEERRRRRKVIHCTLL